MTTEYSQAHKQDSTSARVTGFASAHNVVEELAEATEEIIANLTDKHSQCIKALVKSNNKILAKLTEAIASKVATAASTAAATATKDERRKKWTEKCKNAKMCVNCNKKHPNCTDDKCWELKANAASRPAGCIRGCHIVVVGHSSRIFDLYSRFSRKCQLKIGFSFSFLDLNFRKERIIFSFST